MHWIITYFVCLVAFGILDAVWIGLVASKLYRKEAGAVLRDKAQPAPAIIFYLIYIAGVLLLGVLPLLWHQESLLYGSVTPLFTLGWGFAFGFVAYATFCLTNMAILKSWSAKLAVADMLWGGAATAIVTLVGFTTINAL